MGDVVVPAAIGGEPGGEVDLFDVVHRGHDSLGEQVSGDEFDVVSGGAHGHGVLLTVELDLQRLLPCQGIRTGRDLTSGVELIDPGSHGLAHLHGLVPLSGPGSVVGGVLDGGLNVLEEVIDDGDSVLDPSLRAGEVDDEAASAHSRDPRLITAEDVDSRPLRHIA